MKAMLKHLNTYDILHLAIQIMIFEIVTTRRDIRMIFQNRGLSLQQPSSKLNVVDFLALLSLF